MSAPRRPAAPSRVTDAPARSTAAEQRTIADYAARLRPTVQAAIVAAQAAGVAGKPVKGTADQVLGALGFATLGEGILAALSISALDRWTRSYGGSGQTSTKRREALWDVREDSARAGAQAGAQRLADALRDISAHAHRDARDRARRASQVATSPAGVAPAVPGPGQPVTEKPPYQFANPDGLAQAVAVSTKEAAKYHAAAAAGWTHKTWVDSHDHRVRTTHKILGSRSYDHHRVPVDVPFLSPSGAKLDYPGDPKAPLDEVINCRCHLILSAP